MINDTSSSVSCCKNTNNSLAIQRFFPNRKRKFPKSPCPILRATSSIKNRKNYDFLYYIPNFAKFTLQNTANINIFFIFFAKSLQESRKEYTFAVYYNNSTPQQ